MKKKIKLFKYRTIILYVLLIDCGRAIKKIFDRDC